MSSEICRVESVTVKDHAVFVDAQHLSRPSVEYRNTPLLAGFSGVIAVPQVGQRVVISKDSSGVEYVEGVLTGTNDPVPSVKEGEFVMQFDPETKIKFSKDGSGGFDLSLEASGSVTVSSDTIELGGESETKMVARKGDSIQTTDPLTGTNSGTITSGSEITKSK